MNGPLHLLFLRMRTYANNTTSTQVLVAWALVSLISNELTFMIEKVVVFEVELVHHELRIGKSTWRVEVILFQRFVLVLVTHVNFVHVGERR